MAGLFAIATLFRYGVLLATFPFVSRAVKQNITRNTVWRRILPQGGSQGVYLEELFSQVLRVIHVPGVSDFVGVMSGKSAEN